MPQQYSKAALIVTANQRLARDYGRRHDAEQAAAGRSAWPRLPVLHWSAWVRKLWFDGIMAGCIAPAVLLSRHQTAAVWRQIVEDSPESGQLLRISTTAASAMSAWNLVQQHRIPWTRPSFLAHEDWTAFVRWARAFERRCAAQSWIDEPRLIDVVSEAIEQGLLVPPPSLSLAGFDEFTPQQTRLLKAMSGRGCEWTAIVPEPHDSHVRRVELLDTASELRAAAIWARDIMAAVPRARIGVVIPNLSAVRDSVERIFTEELHPASITSLTPIARPAFHVSIGKPLSRYPVVSAALLLLGMTRGVITMGELGALLRSPFIDGGVAEASNRALLDAYLRRARAPEISMTALRLAAGTCPVLAAALDRWQSAGASIRGTLSPSEWSRMFDGLLSALGWPGTISQDSAEHQTIGAWQHLLEDFAALDLVSDALFRDEALSRLSELASETGFQPEDPDAPVQITGALEAAGAGFDHLWIAGLHDQDWPASAHPHPFLPYPLQMEYTLPHCSAAREYEFAARTTARLIASSPIVIVSHPSRAGERDLRPSPLIRGIPSVPAWNSASPWLEHLNRRASLEQIVDSYAPPLTLTAARGGSRILEHQAACPFHAFAEMRLGARSLDSGSLGVDAATHGSALHKALELFWSEVQTQSRLLELSSDELQTLIASVSAQAVDHAIRPRSTMLDIRFRQLEGERIERVLIEWLAIERSRPPFTVVQEESQRIIEVGPLEITTRIDRVDRLDDGTLAIIDYKTNAPSPGKWEGDRPDQPQVPLYACSATQPVTAVAFAHLLPGGMRFRGMAENGALPALKGLSPGETMKGKIAIWRKSLTALALEYHQGRAVVDPKKEACQYCGLAGLCRVAESGPRHIEELEDAS
jgi:ATP-dependent helicase/nuclease subunit B